MQPTADMTVTTGRRRRSVVCDGRLGANVTCPDCGHELRVVERRTSLQWTWAWFNTGPFAWHERWQCDTCGFSGTDQSFSALSRSPSRSKIVGRWRRFQRSRGRFPVPRFYAILTVAGATVGLVVQATLGWPWWLPALAFPVGGWLWAAAPGPIR